MYRFETISDHGYVYVLNVVGGKYDQLSLKNVFIEL